MYYTCKSASSLPHQPFTFYLHHCMHHHTFIVQYYSLGCGEEPKTLWRSERGKGKKFELKRGIYIGKWKGKRGICKGERDNLFLWEKRGSKGVRGGPRCFCAIASSIDCLHHLIVAAVCSWSAIIVVHGLLPSPRVCCRHCCCCS